MTVFLTENVFPRDPHGDDPEAAAVHLLQQLLLSGGRVLASEALLGAGSPTAHILGVERGTEDDVAALLLKPGIDALWC